MILSKPQAEAVYSAMCALNNVSGRIDATMPTGGGTAVKVYEGIGGRVFVVGEFRSEAHGGDHREFHANQSAFAAAYNLT